MVTLFWKEKYLAHFGEGEGKLIFKESSIDRFWEIETMYILLLKMVSP